MSVAGLCAICERPAADHTCDRCGQVVCDRHFDRETGVCSDCLSELGRAPGRERPASDDLPDGVDSYEF